MLGRRLSRLLHRLWKIIPVLATLLTIFFLVVGIQIFFRVIEMTLTDVVEPLFIEQQGALVVGGILIHFGHRECVDRASLDTISTKDAFGDVDVKLAGNRCNGRYLSSELMTLMQRDGHAASQRSQPTHRSCSSS